MITITDMERRPAVQGDRRMAYFNLEVLGPGIGRVHNMRPESYLVDGGFSIQHSGNISRVPRVLIKVHNGNLGGPPQFVGVLHQNDMSMDIICSRAWHRLDNMQVQSHMRINLVTPTGYDVWNPCVWQWSNHNGPRLFRTRPSVGVKKPCLDPERGISCISTCVCGLVNHPLEGGPEITHIC